jgi:hypothetical protein
MRSAAPLRSTEFRQPGGAPQWKNVYPDSTVAYTGHGDDTTIGTEQ